MKNITVFTRNDCPYCVLLKKYLDAKSVSYETVNIDDHPERHKEIMELTGRAITPTTLVTGADGTKEVIVGCNLARIVPAIA